MCLSYTRPNIEVSEDSVLRRPLRPAAGSTDVGNGCPRTSISRLNGSAGMKRAMRIFLGCLLLGLLATTGSSFRAESITNEAHSVADLTVQDLTGATVRPLADAGQKATVFFFLMHECPVANGYAPEINRMVAEYSVKKVRCFIVYVESDLTQEKARTHVRDYGFKCGALLDSEHLLVKAAGATISPEAAVMAPTGELLYRGRIDDRVADVGKRRVQPTRRDLRLALDAFLAHKPIPARLTKAVGCYIPGEPSVKSSGKSTERP